MKSIAGYNILKLLAKGGMAAIYLAEQTSLQRKVVLKFINPKLDDAIKKSFIDEGQIIASLEHPNIITVFDVVSTGKYNFIAMEYLPDGDLENRLQLKLDLYTSLTTLSKLSEALHVIHKQGIIHGDIKPANVLFRGDNNPILTDFGISHRIEPKKEVELGSDELYASPIYASPELIQGKPFDYRTDMYSLGIMMYEMLLGKKPFSGETEIETIANSIQNPIPTLPDELQGLQPLLDSLLAKSPDERLSDAKLVTRFIDQYLTDHPELQSDGAETKLIDTDVVVEYVVKNNKNNKNTDSKTSNNKNTYFSSLLLTSIFLLILLVNKDVLWERYFSSDASSVNQRTSATSNSASSTVLPLISKTVKNLPQQASEEKQIQPEDNNLEQQKEDDIALLKQQEADKKRLAQIQQQQQSRMISQLLKNGNDSLKKYHLTTPLNDNALYYFQKVLELDKNNKKAQKGIKNIAYRYELLARGELDKYHYQKAQSYINSGLSIDKTNKRLLALQNEANLRHEPKRVINKVKDFFKNF
ncbi:MAG: serine/threonine protein kinase [Gammaproteobacteria bacterium]|nr:serine/threonine protein kinase [Gammaproteobacteria bacterium]